MSVTPELCVADSQFSDITVHVDCPKCYMRICSCSCADTCSCSGMHVCIFVCVFLFNVL